MHRFATNILSKLKGTSLRLSTLPSKLIAVPSSLAFFYMLNKSSANRVKLAEQRRKLSLKAFHDLPEGEMKELVYGSGDTDKILIVRYDGELHALSNYCPHAGAPMSSGFLIDNLVKCPWHGASFDVKSGDMEITPSLDGLERYQVVEENGEQFAILPEGFKKRQVPVLAKRDLKNDTRYVIVGGGAAGMAAAEELRKQGFTGIIDMISEDAHLPYDRTTLSKWNVSIDGILLRKKDFLSEHDIDVRLKTSVQSIDADSKTVRLSDNSSLKYDKLLVATGSSPVTPGIPGLSSIKDNVFQWRSYSDFERVTKQCKGANSITILGSGFIGMEGAALLKANLKTEEIKIVDINPTPFYASLGKEVGSYFQKFMESKGVSFTMGNGVKAFEKGKNKKVKVILTDNSSFETDAVVLGTGVKPNTDILSGKVKMNDRNLAFCDRKMQTSAKDIYVAGDITYYPGVNADSYVNTMHWVNAQQQGAIAGVNMAGKESVFDYVPYFTTRMFEKGMQFAGTGETHDDVFVDGDMEKGSFCAYYFNGNKLVGFAALGKANAANIMYEGFRLNKTPTRNQILNGSASWETVKNRLKGIKVGCAKPGCCRSKLI